MSKSRFFINKKKEPNKIGKTFYKKMRVKKHNKKNNLEFKKIKKFTFLLIQLMKVL
jgi:hypothetical protein